MYEKAVVSSKFLLEIDIIMESMNKQRVNKAISARDALARNLSYLAKKHDHSEIYIGKKAGIASKTVNNMKNGTHNVNLDAINAVASIYGLQGWQLLTPALPDEMFNLSVAVLDALTKEQRLDLAREALNYSAPNDR
jgi:hypothetical protein